jgi:cbb3-type cytochrome c oxidase CcoQ subunit
VVEFIAFNGGYIYFFVVVLFTILMAGYIWYLHGNKERSARYENYSNIVLNDSLGDMPVEARERN